MAAGQMTSPMRHIRRLALQNAGSVGDAQLLGAFLTQKDEAAFEALVRRHGPMVLGVCRRVLRDAHDAQDAFQATFLVLVRKAAAIAKRELLGNWLHGVAFRAALKMKHAKATRHRKERQVDQMSRNQSANPEISEELLSWLDHELNRLPEKYRVAIVFCDLESMTRDQAARKLGWPIGTLNWRLAKARSMVAKGLKRRGLTISCAALAALCQKTAAAAVPPALTAATVKLGTLMAAGTAVKLGMITAQVASLTEGVVKAMFLSKLKTALAVGVVIGALGVGAGRVSYSVLADEKGTAVVDGPYSKESASAIEPAIKPAAAEGQYVVRFGNIHVIVMGRSPNYDEDNDTIFVNGPGQLRMMMSVNFKGEKLSEPRQIIIDWNKDMTFNGKHADFHGGVQAIQDGATLKCKDLFVTLDRTISFKDGRKQKEEAKIDQMVCDRQVVFEHDQKNPTGKRVQFDRLTASQLMVSTDRGPVTAIGPGKVEHLAKIRKFAGGNAEPNASASEHTMQLTRIVYEGRMFARNNADSRSAKYYDNVEFFQFPTDDPNADTHPDKFPKDGFYVKCRVLSVFTRVVESKSSQMIRGDGDVFFRTQEFFGQAAVVKYDESVEQVIFEGTEGNPAAVYRKLPGLRQPQEIKGAKILYNRKTGQFQIERAAQKPPNDPKRKAEDKPASLYDEVFDKAKAILGEYFAIEYADRHEGRIETLAALAPTPETADGGKAAKTQTIRRRATLTIAPSDGGKFHVDVRVLKEASWQAKASSKVYWDLVGRDKQLEQVILRRLGVLPSVKRDNLDVSYLIKVTVVEADPNGQDHGELGKGRILAEPSLVALEGQTCNLQAGGLFPVPIATGAVAVPGVEFQPYGLVCAFTVTAMPSGGMTLQSNVELTEIDRIDEKVTQVGGRKLQSIANLKSGEKLKLTMKNEAGQPVYYINIRVLEGDAAKSTESDMARPRSSAPPNDARYTNNRALRIPINVDKARQGGLKDLVLFASWDEGRTYQRVATASPDATEFSFEAPSDGICWLKVAAIDRDGRREPADIHQGPPGLKIVIDTANPVVKASAERQGSDVLVTWEIVEEHFDPERFRLEYRPRNGDSTFWTTLPATPELAGKMRFRCSAPLLVRLTAFDKAGNQTTATIAVAGENDGAKAPMPISAPNRFDELFQIWDQARKTTRSLVIEFDHEMVDRTFKDRTKNKGTIRLIQTAEGKVFATYAEQSKTTQQEEGLLSGGKLYLLSAEKKLAIRLNTSNDGVVAYLEKWFDPLLVLLDRKRAEQCKRLDVESDKFYTYVHVKRKEVKDSPQFSAGRVAVLNEASAAIPKGMPKQLWYSDPQNEHFIEIRSWRVNETAAPDLKEFQRPEERPGWQVVQWRNSGKGFSLFGGWFEPVTD